MNRKKTILIAVLVNAGLLIILFATAIRTKEKTPVQQQLATAPLFEEIKNSIEPLQAETKEHEFAAIPSFSSFPETTDEVLFVDEPSTPIVAVPVAKPVVAQAPQASNSSLVNVTVKKGDALEKIARANKTTVAAIMQANNLTNSALKVGQVLKVPMSGATPQIAAEPNKKEIACNDSVADYYVVKEGDSPWLIASKSHIKLDELLRLNGLDETKAKKLRPGDRLRIR